MDQLPKLTAKQRNFVDGLSNGLTQAAAYRAAYDTERMTPKQVHEEASKLAGHPKVAQWLYTAQDEARERLVVNIETITRELEYNRSVAEEKGLPSAMNAATLGKARLHGLFSDRAVESNTPLIINVIDKFASPVDEDAETHH